MVNYTAGANTTLPAPLGHVNVHVRDGSAILLHTTPGYTIEETRQSNYSLLVHLTPNGTAGGKAYMDDGESSQPTPFREVEFSASEDKVEIQVTGDYRVQNKLTEITILVNGASATGNVSSVMVAEQIWTSFTWDAQKGELVIKGLGLDLNKATTISWSL